MKDHKGFLFGGFMYALVTGLRACWFDIICEHILSQFIKNGLACGQGLRARLAGKARGQDLLKTTAVSGQRRAYAEQNTPFGILEWRAWDRTTVSFSANYATKEQVNMQVNVQINIKRVNMKMLKLPASSLFFL
ncbi:MAG: hypothetical protein LBS58_00515 [Coriobacteriales bacterium]|nr:hypothetical protein [Coriobacteriales bacterium]